MEKTTTTALLIVFLLCNCKGGNTKSVDDNEISVINISYKQPKEIAFNDIYSDCSYIKLETNDDILISRIDKIEIYNDRIYTLNNNSVCCFDLQGKYLYKIDRKSVV